MSAATDSGRTLIATARFRLVSVARYTLAHPTFANQTVDLIRADATPVDDAPRRAFLRHDR
jgi:hypothetical protein